MDATSEQRLLQVHPALAAMVHAAFAALSAQGTYFCVAQGLRTYAEQDALYAQGRTAPGHIVTNARGGYSNHNFGCAVDCYPYLSGPGGAINWAANSPQFRAMVSALESQGLVWGGSLDVAAGCAALSAGECAGDARWTRTGRRLSRAACRRCGRCTIRLRGLRREIRQEMRLRLADWKTRLLALTVGLLLAPSMGVGAAEKPYTMLYVFGDSYSDSGAGYVDADGPTAVVYLAGRLGIPFTYFGDAKSAGKGLNFAVSGARTGAGDGKRYPHGELLGRGMRNQVDDFAAMVRAGTVKFDAKTTMFFFAGGLNDRGTPEGYTVANIEGEIETLYALGARRFMVAVLPEKIPAFASAGTQFNAGLETIPAEERSKHADISIANSRWGEFFDEVMEHPAKYGIHDTTNPCAGRVLKDQDPTPCATPADHYFYHPDHPSTAVHRAVGQMLYVEAENGSGSR